VNAVFKILNIVFSKEYCVFECTAAHGVPDIVADVTCSVDLSLLVVTQRVRSCIFDDQEERLFLINHDYGVTN